MKLVSMILLLFFVSLPSAEAAFRFGTGSCSPEQEAQAKKAGISEMDCNHICMYMDSGREPTKCFVEAFNAKNDAYWKAQKLAQAVPASDNDRVLKEAQSAKDFKQLANILNRYAGVACEKASKALVAAQKEFADTDSYLQCSDKAGAAARGKKSIQ